MPEISVIIVTVILTSIVSTVFVILLNFKNRHKNIHKLNFRSVTVQLLALTVWVAILGKIFFPNSAEDQTMSLAIFVTSVVIGVFLIRSIFREINTQDEIDKLVKKLNDNNLKLCSLDKQKTEFVSIASHQLRSPLTVVQGYTSMMLEGDFGKVPDNLKEPLTRINSASASLGFLISDFLNISRIEKGQLEYTIEPLNITQILNDILKEFELVAKNHNLVLRTKHNGRLDIIINADIGKLKQVMSNLLDNAIKYTLKGYVETDLVLHNKKVLFSIKDTGIGIAPESIHKIFEKFSRTEKAGLVNVYGSGLGLYVAKVMTESMGGKIWIESDGEGKGSTFFVEFDVVE